MSKIAGKIWVELHKMPIRGVGDLHKMPIRWVVDLHKMPIRGHGARLFHLTQFWRQKIFLAFFEGFLGQF